ncbi:MAG: cyclic nucleotide-binding domain-containing protein [Candidatus Limnocylindrales bacterium]
MADEPVSAADLQRFRLFAGQADADLGGLAASARRTRLPDREVLVHRGERSTDVWLVLGGRIALSMEHEGRSVLVMTLGPGDMLGWSTLRDDPAALTTARCVGATELIAIPADRLRDALTDCTPMAHTLVRRLLEIAAADLEATRVQLLRVGREGVITAG